MRIQGYTSVPKEIIDKAIDEYQFSSSSSIEERMIINQVEHSKKFSPFSVSTKISDNKLQTQFEIEGDVYTRNIPLEHENCINSEIYPFGEVEFINVRAIAVSLRNDFPWAHESYVVSYMAEVSPHNELKEDFPDSKEWVLNQYYPPRKVTGDPVPETVRIGENPRECNFKPVQIGNFLNAKKPNPWAYSSLCVVYENEDVAEKVLSCRDGHYKSDEYVLTPPETNPGLDDKIR